MSAADIVMGTAAVDASDRVIYNSGTGALLYDSNGNAAGSSFQYRRRALLPLDDRLYSLQPSISHRTSSSLLRCLQRHGISMLPDVQGGRADKKKFKTYPIGYFHIDIAEVQAAEDKLYLYVAIDRTSKFAFVQLVKKPTGLPHLHLSSR